MCIQKIKNRIKLGKPKNTKEINHTELYTLLKSELPNANIFLADRKYKTTTLSEYIRMIKYSQIDKYKYVKEYYDCDNFSYALMGDFSIPKWGALCFGILWFTKPPHAVNILVDNEREIFMCEPQNDKITKIPDNYKTYLVII